MIYTESENSSISHQMLRGVPNLSEQSCPSNTYGCLGNNCNGLQTCFCEEHCSWEFCRLVQAPKECLEETKSDWTWDAKKLSWVAQRRGK